MEEGGANHEKDERSETCERGDFTQGSGAAEGWEIWPNPEGIPSSYGVPESRFYLVKAAFDGVTLGGKLSIAAALVWGTSFVGLFFLPYPFLFEIPSLICEFLFIVVSFPLAMFSGVISTGMAPMLDWVAYFFLMVPNCFLIGYILSGIWVTVVGLWKVVSGDGP